MTKESHILNEKQDPSIHQLLLHKDRLLENLDNCLLLTAEMAKKNNIPAEFYKDFSTELNIAKVLTTREECAKYFTNMKENLQPKITIYNVSAKNSLALQEFSSLIIDKYASLTMLGFDLQCLQEKQHDVQLSILWDATEHLIASLQDTENHCQNINQDIDELFLTLYNLIKSFKEKGYGRQNSDFEIDKKIKNLSSIQSILTSLPEEKELTENIDLHKDAANRDDDKKRHEYAEKLKKCISDIEKCKVELADSAKKILQSYQAISDDIKKQQGFISNKIINLKNNQKELKHYLDLINLLNQFCNGNEEKNLQTYFKDTAKFAFFVPTIFRKEHNHIESKFVEFDEDYEDFLQQVSTYKDQYLLMNTKVDNLPKDMFLCEKQIKNLQTTHTRLNEFISKANKIFFIATKILLDVQSWIVNEIKEYQTTFESFKTIVTENKLALGIGSFTGTGLGLMIALLTLPANPVSAIILAGCGGLFGFGAANTAIIAVDMYKDVKKSVANSNNSVSQADNKLSFWQQAKNAVNSILPEVYSRPKIQ